MVVVLLVGMNFAFPQFTQREVKSVTNLGGRLLEMVAGAGTTAKAGAAKLAAGPHYRAGWLGAGEKSQQQQLGDRRL